MLVPTLTVAENVVLGQELTRGLQLDRARAESEVRALSERTGLLVAADRRVSELSVGEAQRVEILKVLYRGARILILDEPTAVLSPPEVRELWAVLRGLAAEGLGRAHHRALYFIARKPDLTVSALLALLAITKQSLGRVLTELTQRGLVEIRPGERDRRQRLLRLTESGSAMESALFDAVRERMSAAYSRAGQEAVAGYWMVLEGMIPDSERLLVEALRD